MPHILLSQVITSISELKKNSMDTVTAGGGFFVAILNRNEPASCCIPTKEYGAMIDLLEDMELAAICHKRESDPTIKVSLDDL